jgi:hypothetical protein
LQVSGSAATAVTRTVGGLLAGLTTTAGLADLIVLI